MLTEAEAQRFASHWVTAWNSHDLDVILSHYAPDVVLTSPIAARLLGDPAGRVSGGDALRSYFSRALQAVPDVHFRLLDVVWGISSVVLYYENQQGTKVGEYMEFDKDGRVVRVVANYSR